MSKIQWTEHTWNPIVGCSKVSAGCDQCYASQDSPHRFPKVYDRESVVVVRGTAKKPGLTWTPSVRIPASQRKGRTILDRHDDGTITVSLGKGAQWTGELRLLPWVLAKPLERKKPTTYFVNSLSDIFHESLVDCEEGRRFIAAIFGVMAACPQHTFQLLTKRPGKAREWFAWLGAKASEHMTGVFPDAVIELCINEANDHLHAAGSRDAAETLMNRWWWATQGEYAFEADSVEDEQRVGRLTERMRTGPQIDDDAWPLPSVWIGTSVENQRAAAERVPELLQVPAALRFLSVEPLLGPVDLDPLTCPDCGRHDVSWGEPGSQPWCVECDTEMGSPGWTDDLDWVIVGGESGPKARPMHPAWARSIRDQCVAVGVPFFFKQWGAFAEVGEQANDCSAPAADRWTHMVGIDGTAIARGKEMPIRFAAAPDVAFMRRCGKAESGRLLDGREWSEMPEQT